MKLQTYLFLIFTVTLISLGTWIMILFNVDPFNTDLISIGAFYATLYLWLTGIITLLLFYLRLKLSNKEIVFAHLPLSLRQATLISISVVVVMIFSSLKVLSWWSGALIIISILLLELFFKTKTIHK